VKFIKANALKLAETIELPFDIIVSNPPYIPESEKHAMQKNVLKYEPHMALFVPDNDPLMFYNAIADFAKCQAPHTKPLPLSGEVEGSHKTVQLYFEIHEDKAKEISELLSKKGFKDIVVKKDINGKDRMLKCTYIC
jgi:release factor glutamine methyltransferase